MQVIVQVFAANQTNGIVVLSSDPKGTEYVEWKAAGDPAGEDVQIIPEAIQRSAQYMKLKQKGIVVEITEEQALGALTRQNEDYQARTAQDTQKITEMIERTENKDILGLPCVGPDARNEGKCGVQVPVTAAAKDDAPPLCNQHIGLAAQYVPEDTEQGRVWRRVSMGPRETAL